MRGHGRSTLPSDHAYFPEALAGDAVALCETLGIDHPVLIGHSFGGFLAAEIARRFPGFARAVVIVDQPLAFEGFHASVAPMEQAIRSAEGHMAFRRGMFESMITDKMPPDAREVIRRSTEGTPVEVAQALWAVLFESTGDELRDRGRADMAALAGQPSLLLDGRETPGYYDLVRSLAPELETRVLDCGHWVHLERPLEFQAALTGFLARL
jgi:pimeloyl-ACP methyl ester carboxylesterase